jgi:hypothetical protein
MFRHVIIVGIVINGRKCLRYIILACFCSAEVGLNRFLGGAFEFVSGANFFGEILEWTGFALCNWSLVVSIFVFMGPTEIAHLWAILKGGLY